MAGGKLTPRQKMINLMYLVFIAMLAMNMSKEVLSAFGLMNEKFESANTSSEQSNAGLLMSFIKKQLKQKENSLSLQLLLIKLKQLRKNFTHTSDL